MQTKIGTELNVLNVIVLQLDALNSYKLTRPSHVYVEMGANEFSFNFTVLFVAK